MLFISDCFQAFVFHFEFNCDRSPCGFLWAYLVWGFSYLHGSATFVSYAKWREFSGIILQTLFQPTLLLFSDSDDTDVESFLLPHHPWSSVHLFSARFSFCHVYGWVLLFCVQVHWFLCQGSVFPYCLWEGLPGVRWGWWVSSLGPLLGVGEGSTLPGLPSLLGWAGKCQKCQAWVVFSWWRGHKMSTSVTPPVPGPRTNFSSSSFQSFPLVFSCIISRVPSCASMWKSTEKRGSS